MLVGLFCLALENRVNGFVLLISGSLVTILLLGTLGAAFIIGSKKRINGFFTYITKFVNRIINIVRPKHPETINVARVQKLFSELHDTYQIVKKEPKKFCKPILKSEINVQK